MLPTKAVTFALAARKRLQRDAVAASEPQHTINIHRSQRLTALQSAKRLIGVNIKRAANHFRIAYHFIVLACFYRP
jgi:hypothetical protein